MDKLILLLFIRFLETFEFLLKFLNRSFALFLGLLPFHSQTLDLANKYVTFRLHFTIYMSQMVKLFSLSFLSQTV